MGDLPRLSYRNQQVVKLFDLNTNGPTPIPAFQTTNPTALNHLKPRSGRNVVSPSHFSVDSLIKPLERPGRVLFDGVEFRAVRDLSHMTTAELKIMLDIGKTPYDKNGNLLIGHHYKQQYHRKPGAFIVEIPGPNHSISNRVQHPYGNAKGKGLTPTQRNNWNAVKKKFNKERAKQELHRRFLLDE